MIDTCSVRVTKFALIQYRLTRLKQFYIPRDTLLVSVIREGILAADPFFLSTSFARRLANLGSTAKLLARITHKVRLLAGYTIFEVVTVDKVIDSQKTFSDNLTYSATFCLFIDATHVLLS